MKARFFHSLYFKLSSGLLGILLILTIVAIALNNYYFSRAISRSEQISAWKLAEEVATPIRILLAGHFSYWEVQQTLRQFTATNPKLELYLLDSQGRILADSGGTQDLVATEIPLEPISNFLSTQAHLSAPLFGLNPRQIKESTVFTAAQIILGKSVYYIYGILMNDEFKRILITSQVGSMFYGLPTGFLIAAGAAYCCGFALFYTLTKQLHTASSAVAVFGKGDYSKRLVTGNASDEISILIRTINSMADAIEENIQALKHKDSLRRELIASISHDLRSPATMIFALGEVIMQERSELSDSIAKKCSLILDNANALNRLLSDLFELAKFEAKELEPAKELFSIEELAEELVTTYQVIAEKQGVALKVDYQKPLPRVIGDTIMIGRVLTNLVDNALRYTPVGGTVTISIKEGDNITVSIGDTGIGIPDQDLPHVFERFYQVQQTNGSKNGLSGLGLAIVKRIIEAHGGVVRVTSEVNQGTTFSFDLPMES